jgi:nucleoside-diphosphate-sugar epimerase
MKKILITGGNGNIAKIIKNKLSSLYYIECPTKNQLNVLNINEISNYLLNKNFDILIHTAIVGGRRTKEETSDVVYKNLIMFENLLMFANKFKMIINLDSAAIYDRSTDIFNRKEEDLFTVPLDYYGLSKYLIYKRTLCYNNIFNFRIFNIFHENEENDRFIKSCFISKKNNTSVNIFEDKYFDFMYKDDFLSILEYYLKNIDSISNLEKTINICYNKKYKLSDIAKLILNSENNINILDKYSRNNYSGDSNKLDKLNIKLNGLEKSLKDMELNF